MCNLYSRTRPAGMMRTYLGEMDLSGTTDTFESRDLIFPDNRALIVVREAGHLRVMLARWGLPSPIQFVFGRRTDMGVPYLRDLTLPHWQRYMDPANRCLVPFDQFAEPVPGGTDIWFEMKKGAGFFAGVVARNWKSTRLRWEGETTNDLYGFLVTDANPLVAQYHPQEMPVILSTPDACNTWLSAQWREASALLRPLEDGLLKVSRHSTRL